MLNFGCVMVSWCGVGGYVFVVILLEGVYFVYYIFIGCLSFNLLIINWNWKYLNIYVNLRSVKILRYWLLFFF